MIKLRTAIQLILPLIVAISVLDVAAASSIRVRQLLCEGKAGPTFIGTDTPRLTWKLESRDPSARNVCQTGYRVLVASKVASLRPGKADMWDSGKIVGSETAWIRYRGTPLKSAHRYFWKVQIWDEHGQASDWSSASFWDTGLKPADWNAAWIGAAHAVENAGAPCMRQSLQLKPDYVAVRAYICSAGYHELYVNGRKADDRVLEPAQTEYPHHVLYSCYDITPLVCSGKNLIGVILGNGWYNQEKAFGGFVYGHPAIKARIEAEYPNGTRIALVSSPVWQAAPGPVVQNNVYGGEAYDARLEIDWNGSTGWEHVQLASGPVGTPVLLPLPPIRRCAEISPVKITRQTQSRYIYDLGQNFAGWVRIKARYIAGTELRFRFAETIDPKTGEIDTASTGVFATNVEQIDRYICSGKGIETWEPRFTYHGFRYVEVTGIPIAGAPPTLKGIVVHNDVKPSGGFVCSDPILNRIHQTAIWTLISNLHGHPTDCPARERCGWLGDAHADAEMAALSFDMSGFWQKYIEDLDAGWVSDRPPAVVPGKRIAGASGPIDWGVAVVMLPYFHWLYYGDRTELNRCYPLMARFVRAAYSTSKDGILTEGLGDWCPPGSVEPTETPPALTTTAWFCRAADVTAKIARLQGAEKDADEFDHDRSVAHDALLKQFFNTRLHSFGSQTGNALCLAFNLCSKGEIAAVEKTLQNDVTVHDYHHTTGIFGSRWLNDMLVQSNHADIAMKLLHQTTYPSIGHLFSLGATTFWECWGEPELDKKWGARSLNHPMQACGDAWFIQGPGGIRPSPDGPGFRHFTIAPQLLPSVDSVCCWHDSPNGKIKCGWTRKSGMTQYRISIPPNCTATAVLQAEQGNTILERGKALSVQGLSATWGKSGAEINLASGEYVFDVETK